jgi:hypothetical protein
MTCCKCGRHIDDDAVRREDFFEVNDIFEVLETLEQSGWSYKVGQSKGNDAIMLWLACPECNFDSDGDDEES